MFKQFIICIPGLTYKQLVWHYRCIIPDKTKRINMFWNMQFWLCGSFLSHTFHHDVWNSDSHTHSSNHEWWQISGAIITKLLMLRLALYCYFVQYQFNFCCKLPVLLKWSLWIWKKITFQINYVKYLWMSLHSFMMTSSNGNIFRVTGPLCGEFAGHRWISRTKASDAELWCFPWSAPE